MKTGEHQGEARGRHSGGGDNVSGPIKYQLIETRDGSGVLNVAITRRLRQSWANSINIADIGAVEPIAQGFALSYARNGRLEVTGTDARTLMARLRDELARREAGQASARTGAARSVGELTDAGIHRSRKHVRFHRLFPRLRDDLEVQRILETVPADVGVPPEVDRILQDYAARLVDHELSGLAAEGRETLGSAFYTLERRGWAVGLLFFQTTGRLPDDDELLRRAQWDGLSDAIWTNAETLRTEWVNNDAAGFSDIAFYLLDNFMDAHVADLLGSTDPVTSVHGQNCLLLGATAAFTLSDASSM